MLKSFYGFKDKVTQTFNKKGKRLAVTFLKVEPIVVKKIKDKKKDGYLALQVILKKQNKKILKEIRIDEIKDFKIGDKVKINQIFKEDEKVTISGISKGKGFAGAMKRWGFKGGPRTHGQSDRQRAPGSIGQGTDPGRVWKGKKMPGRMGRNKILIKGLKIFKIDEEKNEMIITGLIPGEKGEVVEIIKEKYANS